MERLKNRLITPSQILAEQGEDYVDFLDRWESDRKLAAEKGINIDELYAEPKAAPAAKEPDDKEEKPPKTVGQNGYSNGKYSEVSAF